MSVAYSHDSSRIVSGDFSGNVIERNWIASLPPQLHLQNTTIRRSTAPDGACIFLGDGRASIANSTLEGCFVRGIGGVLAVDGGNLTLDDDITKKTRVRRNYNPTPGTINDGNCTR